MPTPVTSSWSTRLPPGHVRVGISRGSPRRQSGYRRYAALAPGPWFASVSAGEFRRLYMAQLSGLDPEKVLLDLGALAGGLTPVLACFERPPPDPAWCHRGLVSAWLFDTLGIAVVEFGHENEGYGWRHPKLPDRWRHPSP